MQPLLPSCVPHLNWIEGNACLKSWCLIDSQFAIFVIRMIEIPGTASMAENSIFVPFRQTDAVA